MKLINIRQTTSDTDCPNVFCVTASGLNQPALEGVLQPKVQRKIRIFSLRLNVIDTEVCPNGCSFWCQFPYRHSDEWTAPENCHIQSFE